MARFAYIANFAYEGSACEGATNDILCCFFDIPIDKVIAWIDKDKANLAAYRQCFEFSRRRD